MQEKSLYYSQRMYRRVLKAITKPPQLCIDTQISAITAAMTEIEKQSPALHSQRLKQVHQRVTELQRKVDDIKDGVKVIETKSTFECWHECSSLN